MIKSSGVKPRRSWVPLSMSAAVHLMLIIFAVHSSRQPAVPERSREVVRQVPYVDMIYVPPPPPAPKPPAHPPPTSPPAQAQPAPEPEPNAPPEVKRTDGTEEEDTGPAGGDRIGSAPAPQPAARPVEATATLESEARRIFGRPRLSTPAGAGPQARRPMESVLPDDPANCTPKPSQAGDSSGAQFGVVVGRIYRQDDGLPLAGAHLQMLGAPYVAFTDDNGEYRFRFDLALVDNCRTQYVRVSARGYESRLLVLVVGPNARSEDVRLRRQ